jgi:hypothetical protein
LQGLGPRAAAYWFRDILESECGPILFTVSRLDLFADFQGWDLDGDARKEFVSRATARTTYEDDDIFTGFAFGRRKTGTVSSRIYDKSITSENSSPTMWKMIWGKAYDPLLPVLRVEFELGRNGLREYGLSNLEETLDSVGSLWASLTSHSLSHRTPTSDLTRSRWPISPQWLCVSRALASETDHGVNRMYLGKRRGGLEALMPLLTGCIASFGAFAEGSTLDEILPDLRVALNQRERDTGISLTERITAKRRKLNLP